MEKLIKEFSTQLGSALRIGESAVLSEAGRTIANVVISGMGGSGIGGAIASEIAMKESRIPILVSNNYFLPEFVNENTLVIISSYSGNTEETVNALHEAVAKGAKLVCIASGGKIIEIAKGQGLDHIQIPNDVIAEGVSSPRAAIGYSLVQLFFILNHFNIISDKFKDDLKASIQLIKTESENIQNEARAVAEKIFNKFPIVYAPAGSQGIAVRFKQQLNENAKMLAWYNTIPEMNHNELLGWEGGADNMAVIIFRNSSDYERIQKRIEFSKTAILKHTANVIEIYSKGNSPIERAIYHIHIGDFVSIHLAGLRAVDPNDLGVIEQLKANLASA